jgi:hypothetical protein
MKSKIFGVNNSMHIFDGFALINLLVLEHLNIWVNNRFVLSAYNIKCVLILKRFKSVKIGKWNLFSTIVQMDTGLINMA